jgi:hypothetical protein
MIGQLEQRAEALRVDRDPGYSFDKVRCCRALKTGVVDVLGLDLAVT